MTDNRDLISRQMAIDEIERYFHRIKITAKRRYTKAHEAIRLDLKAVIMSLESATQTQPPKGEEE